MQIKRPDFFPSLVCSSSTMRLWVQGSLTGGSCLLDEGPASLALIADLQKMRKEM
jgi:hypothetical protein